MGRDMMDHWVQTLRLPRRRRQDITRELQAHLDESRRDLLLAGWQPEDATRESIERLGDPAEIAEGFQRVYRPSRRNQFGLAVALATAMVLGVYGIGGGLVSANPSRVHHHPVPHRVPLHPQ